MISLEALRKKIQNTQDLHSVVRTMKAIAATNIHHYQEVVLVLGNFFQTVEMGLQIAMKRLPEGVFLAQQEPDVETGMILLSSDQGMVGQFNQVIAAYVVDEIHRLDIRFQSNHILGVGIRGVSRLEQRGVGVERVMSMPGSLAGITPVVQDILFHIRSWREEQDIERIFIFYNAYQRGAAYEPATMQLLPVSYSWLEELAAREWPNQVVPTFRGSWDQLFAQLIQQFFFVSIYRAVVESLASENASRLAAMQVAEKNIEERLDEITLEYHQLRQSSITMELIDIIAGTEALEPER